MSPVPTKLWDSLKSTFVISVFRFVLVDDLVFGFGRTGDLLVAAHCTATAEADGVG